MPALVGLMSMRKWLSSGASVEEMTQSAMRKTLVAAHNVIWKVVCGVKGGGIRE